MAPRRRSPPIGAAGDSGFGSSASVNARGNQVRSRKVSRGTRPRSRGLPGHLAVDTTLTGSEALPPPRRATCGVLRWRCESGDETFAQRPLVGEGPVSRVLHVVDDV